MVAAAAAAATTAAAAAAQPRTEDLLHARRQRPDAKPVRLALQLRHLVEDALHLVRVRPGPKGPERRLRLAQVGQDLELGLEHPHELVPQRQRHVKLVDELLLQEGCFEVPAGLDDVAC